MARYKEGDFRIAQDPIAPGQDIPGREWSGYRFPFTLGRQRGEIKRLKLKGAYFVGKDGEKPVPVRDFTPKQIERAITALRKELEKLRKTPPGMLRGRSNKIESLAELSRILRRVERCRKLEQEGMRRKVEPSKVERKRRR